MRIAIIGSRNFKDLARITECLVRIKNSMHEDITIISGGALGVDQHAIEQAAIMGFKTNDDDYLPDLRMGIPACYHIRNDKLIADADKVIAFWDGASKGTESVINKCLKKRKNIEVIFDKQLINQDITSSYSDPLPFF